MQINLTGFLNGKNARIFMGELWTMLDAAQNNPAGIPQEIIDQKKKDVETRRVRITTLKLVPKHSLFKGLDQGFSTWGT